MDQRTWATWHVTCPHCGAKPRVMCTTPTGRRVREHVARERAADELYAQGLDPRSAHRR